MDVLFKRLTHLPEEELILTLSTLLIVSGVIMFIYLVIFKQKGTYGRYGHEAFFTNLAVPARIAWFIQETPSFILPVIALAYYGENVTLSKLIPFLMFVGHYWNRTFCYPFLIVGGKPTPPQIFLVAIFLCTWNGYIQAFYHVKYAVFEPDHPRQILSQLGIALYFTGLFINIHSDSILRNLRKPGETGYKIPRGGIFEFVSGANYLGEILEWAGYALYCRTLPAFAFFIFTVSNTGPRAYHHHEWYKTKFEDYPKERYAIIPFVL